MCVKCTCHWQSAWIRKLVSWWYNAGMGGCRSFSWIVISNLLNNLVCLEFHFNYLYKPFKSITNPDKIKLGKQNQVTSKQTTTATRFRYEDVHNSSLGQWKWYNHNDCTIRSVQKGVQMNPLLNTLFPIKFNTHNKGPNWKLSLWFLSVQSFWSCNFLKQHI